MTRAGASGSRPPARPGATRPRWHVRRAEIVRVRDIPVRADATLLVIAVLVAASFWARFSEGAPGAVALAMSLVATAGFLLSILAHEIAHALEAKRRGLQVEDVTLYVFGGATRITSEVERPGDEFALAAVGPWTSLVLAGAFGLVAVGASALGLVRVGDVAAELGWLNALLGVFNLIPGAPLDGGRLLEALVWRLGHDRGRAIAVASGAGQVLGIVLVAAGLFEMLVVVGGFVAGLWFVLIGWFIARSAAGEGASGALRMALAGRRVGELVREPLAVVARGTPAGFAAFEAHGECAGEWTAVRGEEGRVVGVLRLVDVALLEPRERCATPVEALMVEVGALGTVSVTAPAVDLLAQLEREPVLVMDGGDVVAVFTVESLVAAAGALRPRTGALVTENAAGAAGAPARRHVETRGRWVWVLVWLAGVAVIVASLVVVPLPVFDAG